MNGWRDGKEMKVLYFCGGCGGNTAPKSFFFFKAATVTINSNVLLDSLRSNVRCEGGKRWMREQLSLSLSLIFLNEMRQDEENMNASKKGGLCPE